MRTDLEPLTTYAKRQNKSTKRMRRELETIEASHAHVLGKRRIVVQRRHGGKLWVDRVALRMLEKRHDRSRETERIRELEQKMRVVILELETLLGHDLAV